jgi:toxin HigB-1
MIQSFNCNDTRALFDGRRVARFKNFESVAMRKLQQLHAAIELNFLRVPPGNWKRSRAIALGSTVFGLTINGGFALCGQTATPIALKLWTITEGETL